MDAKQFDTGLDVAELNEESVELLPNRQTLSCNHGSFSGGLDLGLGLQLSIIGSGRGGY